MCIRDRYEEDDKIFQALSAGASGYILKKTDPARMLEAIRAVSYTHLTLPTSDLV